MDNFDLNSSINGDTIAALATAPGKGGVAIIRLSGPKAYKISTQITEKKLKPRYAHYGNFYQIRKTENNQKAVIDQGIALYFPAPHSFTGEDVVELQ